MICKEAECNVSKSGQGCFSCQHQKGCELDAEVDKLHPVKTRFVHVNERLKKGD
jgi:hypothetical protein